MKEMCYNATNCFNKDSRDGSTYKVKEMRNSIHSYMLVASNRFIDQSHMWILQNFVMEYKHNFYRKLDQEYSPNSGTMMGEDVKSRMLERPSEIKKRKDT